MKLLERVAEQGGADERRFLRARALERFGATAKALEACRLLRKLHPDTPEGRQAAEAVQRLQDGTRLEPGLSPRRFPGGRDKPAVA